MTAIPPGSEVSVVLCTYNGERYLEPQLDSLARQTRLPQELVVRDDGSSDRTPAIVHAFATRAPFAVRWARNETRLGPGANFGAAILDAGFPLIALCDQDDVWLPEKLERLVGALDADPRAPFAFSDATVVDAGLQPLGYTLWQTARCTTDVQRSLRTDAAFSVLLRRNVVTGATMMFRAEHRDRALPVAPEWIHDGWLALMLSVLGPPALVEAPLMLYRQHDANHVGGRRRSLVAQVREPRRYFGSAAHEAAEQFASVARRLEATGAPQAGLAQQKARFLRERAALGSSLMGRAANVLRLQVQGEYGRYADGVRSALKDLLRPER